MTLFKNNKKESSSNNNDNNEKVNNKDNDIDSTYKYKEAFKTGSSIADLATSTWNSQKNPGKTYVANRRLHHGAVGSVMKLSKYFKKSEPTATQICILFVANP